MINKVSNFDKTKAIVLGLIFYLFIIVTTGSFIEWIIGRYFSFTYPSDRYNMNSIYNFISVLGILLSFSFSTYLSSKGKLRDISKYCIKYFLITFILGIILFLSFAFFVGHVVSMSGYTAIVLLIIFLEFLEKLGK